MYFLLSPAKSLNESDAVPVNVGNHYSQPALIEHSCELMAQLKQLEPTDLQTLMSISDELAQLNAKRNQDWHTPFTDSNAKPAAYLFAGDVYTGLDMYGLNKDAVIYSNQHVGILSGLYGLLKPLDLIQAYRLEMGTQLHTDKGDTLYEFWGDAISELINQRLAELAADDHSNTNNSKDDTGVLVNLASNEYFKAVNKKALNARIITPRFEDCKNGNYKVISFYAKKARGLMVRYAAEQQLSDIEGLKAFDLAGYYYVDELSDDKTWTYRRDEQGG